MEKDRRYPVTLKVEIEPRDLKKVVEQGRLLEFVDAFSTLAAGHIKVQLVEQLAGAGVGLKEIGKEFSISIGFDIDEPFGTVPKPWPWPPRLWGFEQIRSQVQELVKTELAHATRM